MDSDMEIVGGYLRDLCIPGHVVCPSTVQSRYTEICGWFFVCPKELLFQLLPFNQPSQRASEGIDAWTWEFNDLHRDHFISSDKLVVTHGRNQSYGRYFNQIREEDAVQSQNNREVMQDRHRQRLLEDAEYAEKWGDT